jgi:hypothetical protein
MLHRFWQRRCRVLKQELERISEDLLQLVELQADMYGRMNHDLKDIEDKVLDLAVPSADAPLPLERRHQVLTLARKGIGLAEIARRLNIPKGEAELILSLRKYTDAKEPANSVPAAGKAYARA